MPPIRVIAIFALAAAFLPGYTDPAGEWPYYGGDPGGQRFSPLRQIDRTNVASLKIAWTFRTGDAYQPPRGRPAAFEATPLYVEGTLYVSTPLGHIFALDPLTAKVRWTYDAKVPKDAGYGDFANRGVSMWQSPNGERRIFLATVDARLVAVDVKTGASIRTFGENGAVDLRKGLRISPRDLSDYEETSPPAIVGNTVIVGSGIADNAAVDQPSGEVRGFDAITGKLKWTWDPMPKARIGAANAWSVVAADLQRGLVFIPTGSASPDYYGGERLGNDLYANSVVALRADTGRRVWHFQTIHHDLWDYDVASPPILFDVHRDGRSIPAIGVGSKSANFFILNRENGKPVFGVEERAVPKSDIPGESASATQPFPITPPPLSPHKLTAADAWGPDDASRQWCRDVMSKLRADGVFTPPSVRGSLIVPGNIGGMAWGGAAYDRENHLLLIPTNNLAAEVKLIPRADFAAEVRAGRNLEGDWEFAEQRGTPYGMARRFLRSPGGWPCTPPPWGTLHAIDPDSGRIKWSVPTGRLPALGSAPAPQDASGSISLGGPIVTAGGLVFMAGTLDRMIRAYDVSSGKELWKAELPTTARATPMTFMGPDGKQYVVIAVGGHGIPPAGPVGDYLIAFALP